MLQHVPPTVLGIMLYVAAGLAVVLPWLLSAKPWQPSPRLTKRQIAKKLGFSFAAQGPKKWQANMPLLTQVDRFPPPQYDRSDCMRGYYEGIELRIFEINYQSGNRIKWFAVTSFEVAHLYFPSFRFIPRYQNTPLVLSECQITLEQPRDYWFNHVLLCDFDEDVRTAVKHLFAGKISDIAYLLTPNGQLLCDGCDLYFVQDGVLKRDLNTYLDFIGRARKCLTLLATAAEKSPKLNS